MYLGKWSPSAFECLSTKGGSVGTLINYSKVILDLSDLYPKYFNVNLKLKPDKVNLMRFQIKETFGGVFDLNEIHSQIKAKFK